MLKIIIIGGGIAGLAAAVHLKAGAKAHGKAVDVLLLEKGNRVGGKILTETFDKFLIEGGPDSFLPEKVWQSIKTSRPGRNCSLPTKFKGTYIYSKRSSSPFPKASCLWYRPLQTYGSPT
jgi:oxygen-dependent protoporphyrinogen oxidase